MAGGRGSANTTNPDMDRVIQVIADMAAAITQQTMAMTQRDLQQQQRAAQNVESKGLTDFCKHDPPKFQGSSDPEKADLWLQEIEKIFEVINCPEHVKVTYASYMLLGDAEYWWKSTKQMLVAEHRQVTWAVFRSKFLDKYFPESARNEKEQEFLRLHQGNMTVSEYAAKFESLSKYFSFFRDHVDEHWMSEKFERGLRYEIKESVLPLSIRKFQPLVEKSIQIENMKKERVRKNESGGPIRTHGNTQKGKQRDHPYRRPYEGINNREQYRPMVAGSGSLSAGKQHKDEEPRCYRCGKLGHFANKCSEVTKVCYNCRKPGHISTECKAPKAEPTVNATSATRPKAKGRVYCMDVEEATCSDLIQGVWRLLVIPYLFSLIRVLPIHSFP